LFENTPPSGPGERSSSALDHGKAPLVWDDVPFLDHRTARQYIERICTKLSPPLTAALPSLFSESPDPDSALILFDQLVCDSPEIARLLDRYHYLAHYALIVFGHSRYLGDTLVQNTDLFQSFLREKNLDRSFSREGFHEALARFRARSFEPDVSVLLARFKRREYVRIMLRDVLKIAPLAETTAEISALSDVLIEDALREAESRLLRKYEWPKTLDSAHRLVDIPFAIFSLGKLGGSELNYSSDVDLLFMFGDGKEPKDTGISHREYFVRLAQSVTEILSRVTSEGPAFRIDLRLRPLGNEGELAIGLAQALRYYASQAHDWERQALIKVRHTAGNQALAREFMRGIQVHVYSEQINFAAVKTALMARERMHTSRRSKKPTELSGDGIDIKIDAGGIRDIEFLVQCLQRVYGGEEPWLRSGGTLFSLQKLHDKRHISGKEFHDLTSAYEFLRHLEHRLQLRQGQQTHRLPLSGLELRILRRCMEGYEPGEYRLSDLVATVTRRMAAVAEIYQRVIYQQQTRRHQEVEEAEFRLRSVLEPGAADQSNQQILERLSIDAPGLHEIACTRDLSIQARKNLFRFFSAAFTTSERYSVLVRHPAAVKRALVIFDSSDFLTDILVRHPEEIASLEQWDETPSRLGVGQLFESVLGPATVSKDPIVEYLVSSELSGRERLILLRQHYRHRVFTSGARDLAELGNVYRSFSANTAAAEDAIAAAYGIAGRPDGLAILGLGRLGAGEFDILSDADLLFVCADDEPREELSKAAAQLMQTLAAYTQDGMVFPVDARLRPQGGDGELVFSPSRLAAYCLNEAQAWEALTYTKLRFLGGSRTLGELALSKTKPLFDRFSAEQDFLEAVLEMRSRLEPETEDYSFKTSAGGIYDIDFVTGYLLVKHNIREKGGTLRDRLWRCAGAGAIDRSDAATLDHAAELVRTADHVVRLVAGRAHKWLPPTEHARHVAERLTGQILKRQFGDGLEAELLATFRQVREVYERVMKD